jgi:hypothetical protein
MKIQKVLAGLALATAVGVFASSSAFADSTTVVRSADMATSIADVLAEPSSWFFYNDETDAIDSTLGSFVYGPETAPLGFGSVEISVTGTQRRNLATYQFSGTELADITTLAYSTFNASAGNGGSADRAGYLQFNVDFNADNGTVVQDEWQEWDALNSGDAMWRYSGPTWPGTAIAGTTPRTWDDILASYPGVRVRVTDSWLGIRVGEPYADGYTANLDAFKFGTAAGVTTFDFEPDQMFPTSKDECKKDGWMSFLNPVFKNQGDCISQTVSNSNSKHNR